MYNLVFYFFYGMFRRRVDGEQTINSLGATILIISVHTVCVWHLLARHQVVRAMPHFSKRGEGKLFFFIFCLVVIGPSLLYFTSKRTAAIIAKYDAAEDFYSFGRVMLIAAFILAPALAAAML